jgi:hypothetical protein
MPSTDTILVQVDGIWTLFYKGRTYIALLDARSRDDALTQIAEMMFMTVDKRVGLRLIDSPMLS